MLTYGRGTVETEKLTLGTGEGTLNCKKIILTLDGWGRPLKPVTYYTNITKITTEWE